MARSWWTSVWLLRSRHEARGVPARRPSPFNVLRRYVTISTTNMVVSTATPLSDEQRRKRSAAAITALLEIARDLTSSLAARDRYARLLAAIRRVIPVDAACLLRLEGDVLVPVAAHGLVRAALTRRYDRREHPRLDAILRSPDPVRFPADSPLPDPFDGLIEDDPRALEHVHACVGCALDEGGEVIGALTLDALDPAALDGFDTRFLATLGA